MQELYNDLIARGSASLNAALAVGRDIETLDIAVQVSADPLASRGRTGFYDHPGLSVQG